MGFKKFIDDAWMKHEKQTTEVVSGYTQGIELLQSEEDVLGLARLASHVATDHNFNFETATVTLEKLQQHSLSQGSATQSQLKRMIATMKFIAGQAVDVSQLSVSDRTIIFISAAASFLFQKNFEKSETLLNNAIAASHSIKDSKDPAFRTLAMSTNNMAAAISERAVLNAHEKRLMIDLAQYARNFWEKAGTWLQVERAEYYLSKYFRKINDFENAEQHALLCLHICEKEKAEPLEHFFAHEALALTFREKGSDVQYHRHLEQMHHYFNQCQESDQSWMRESLEKLAKN